MPGVAPIEVALAAKRSLTFMGYDYTTRKEQQMCTRCSQPAVLDSNLCSGCRADQAEYHRLNDPKKLNRERKRNFVDEIKVARGCSVCGERDKRVLDFHHVDQTAKRWTIADGIMRGKSFEDLLIEIEKCVVLCANDHRRQHADER